MTTIERAQAFERRVDVLLLRFRNDYPSDRNYFHNMDCVVPYLTRTEEDRLLDRALRMLGTEDPYVTRIADAVAGKRGVTRDEALTIPRLRLTERQRQVLVGRYGMGTMLHAMVFNGRLPDGVKPLVTHDQLAEEMGLSHARTSQLEAMAMYKLREHPGQLNLLLAGRLVTSSPDRRPFEISRHILKSVSRAFAEDRVADTVAEGMRGEVATNRFLSTRERVFLEELLREY